MTPERYRDLIRSRREKIRKAKAVVVQPPSHLAIPEPGNIVFLLALQE